MLVCVNPPEVVARVLDAHRLPVHHVVEAYPLGVRFFISQIERAIRSLLQGDETIDHQLALANHDAHAAVPWTLIAIMTGIGVPFFGIFISLRICGFRKPLTAPTDSGDHRFRILLVRPFENKWKDTGAVT